MFTLKIKTDNAAFGDEPANETARILREIAKKLEASRIQGRAIDLNGNIVGEWVLA